MMRFYRWRWDESPGAEQAEWGPSTWLWAEDDDRWSVEQWEFYDGGQVLHYDAEHPADQYGMLADKRSDPATWPPDVQELNESEYRSATAGLRPLNR
jgi:hypothetical protein